VDFTVELILVFVLLTDMTLLGTGRLATSIWLCAVQGVALGVLPLLVAEHEITLRLVVFAAVVFALKGIVFPRLLSRAARMADVKHEVEPIVGYSASILIGLVIVILSAWVGAAFPLPHLPVSPVLLPTALATILSGLFLIVSRRTALTQVVGYLVLENGIYILGAALAQEEPFLVEMCVLLDVFVAVFVMGIAIFHISREFDHIDVDQLTSLKD
jgi:hydrogenase-4 component E